LENNFDGLEYLHILRGKNEITDELAKLGSSRAMVPTGVFLQKLHEPTISNALAKANKAVESSEETPPPPNNITESPEVMEIHSDWRTPFMIYLKTGACQRTKSNANDCVDGLGSTHWSMTSYIGEALMAL
jgi:hypothetical protein